MSGTDPGERVLIVEARFYQGLADELVAGATAALDGAGVAHDRIAVPGAFEIPGAIRLAQLGAERGTADVRYAGYVALGVVIRGETTHYDYVCGESARGLQELALHHGLAIGYGILTCETGEQAWARARVREGNKGAAAAEVCLAMMALRRRFGLVGG